MKDLVKAKIIELVPEIPVRHKFNGKQYECEITLADVLRAIGTQEGHNRMYEVHEDELNLTGIAFDQMPWNLTKDFEGQTDEVKGFIGELLGV